MQERTKLIRHHFDDDIWLSAVESIARLEIVDRLGEGSTYPTGSFSTIRLTITQAIEQKLSHYLALEESLRQAWRDSGSYGAQTGVTSVRPHRTILGIYLCISHQAQRCAEYCSTGEQKILLITILLAHARLMAEVQSTESDFVTR